MTFFTESKCWHLLPYIRISKWHYSEEDKIETIIEIGWLFFGWEIWSHEN